MVQTATPAAGWSLIAEHEGATSLIASILHLDADGSYTRSELAEAAGVPLKELYLSDALAVLADVGLLDRVEDTEEATYTINEASPIYQRAADFEAAVAAQLEE